MSAYYERQLQDEHMELFLPVHQSFTLSSSKSILLHVLHCTLCPWQKKGKILTVSISEISQEVLLVPRREGLLKRTRLLVKTYHFHLVPL